MGGVFRRSPAMLLCVIVQSSLLNDLYGLLGPAYMVGLVHCGINLLC